MSEEDKKTKPDTQQVAVSRESMRKVKLYAASNYMTISRALDLAISNFCDGMQIHMHEDEHEVSTKGKVQ